MDDALGAGEPLLAHDLAREALVEGPDDLRLEHRLVLALARSGAVHRAEVELARRDLVARAAGAEPVLREDVLALRARLAKDRALAATGLDRRRLAAEASALYEEAAGAGATAYPLVNAAVLALVAGQEVEARRLAEAALTVDPSEGGYWALASRAEAAAVLGARDQVELALGRARALDAPVAWRAATRRQLRLLAATAGRGDDLVELLPVPQVIHYTGHRLRYLPRSAERLRDQIDTVLDDLDVGVGHGSLAAGADIVFAESLSDRGATVRVVLPYRRDEFVERSVAPAGAGWVDRFEAAIDAVDSVEQASDGPYRGDDCLYVHASRLAMGRAIIEAAERTTEPVQLAVWDGIDGEGVGTGGDVASWRAAGWATRRIEPEGDRVGGGGRAPEPPPRRVAAALFGDLSGFSRLDDGSLPVFFEHVMGVVGEVVERAGSSVLYRNTWGDGLYLVVDSAPRAARLALDLQQALDATDLADLGLPGDLRLRLGGHAGPVFEAHDPVCDERTYFGRTVTTAARIEPRTPEGEVYVSAPFARLLAVEGDGSIRPEYVGRLPTAKGYGDRPMYVLVED